MTGNSLFPENSIEKLSVYVAGLRKTKDIFFK